MKLFFKKLLCFHDYRKSDDPELEKWLDSDMLFEVNFGAPYPLTLEKKIVCRKCGDPQIVSIFHQIIKNQQTIINQNIRLEKYWIDYRKKNGESLNP